MNINSSLDFLFRHEYANLVSALTNKFSSAQIDVIEDAVQDALLKASQVWAYKEIPQNPSGWLYRAAYNKLIDHFRRNKFTGEESIENLIVNSAVEIDEAEISSGISDNLVRMIFACAHPALKETEQIMLSLKLLIGLNVNEIAAAMLKNYDGVKKAITRAKTKFKNEVGRLEVPPETELHPRLEVVLKVLYLVFNEGYKSTGGEQLIKKDICAEAIRLAFVLYEHEDCSTPDLKALMALMYLKSARFDARINDNGELVTMEFQNRHLWNREHIASGLKYLNESAYGKHISRYHLEAGIESEYMISESYEKINWKQILMLYNMLLDLQENPVVKLNRIVVLEKIEGAEEAMTELKQLEESKDIVDNYLFHAIKADLQFKLNDPDCAKESLIKAADLTDNEIEKRFLQKKLNEIET